MDGEHSRMKIKIGPIEGTYVWQMPVFEDNRGSLQKSYVAGQLGSFPIPFQMFEHFFTYSKKNVFRGMHFQGDPHGVSKIVSIIKGRATDFLLDFRVDSETYGNLKIQEMDSDNPVSIYIPHGVAHGYISLENETIMSYKFDGFFCANCDGGISGEILNEYLLVDFSTTIRSEKDMNLQGINDFKYQTSCQG
jgi:dTDP-4-dehydrorhamnose 3,5-epimerase